jgi:Protein of unknown function (DUF559)
VDAAHVNERAIAAVAASQHGVIARRQLSALGYSAKAIDGKIARGHLHSVHLGVYAVGHPRLVGPGRWMAAVLACGPGALISHLSAAALWGLLKALGSLIDVTAPRSREGRPGIALHRPRRLHAADRAMVDGIPVTSVARTLLDLAATRPLLLERAFEAADRLDLLDLRAIEHVLERSRGCPGRPALAALLTDHRGPAPVTRSELERRFLDVRRDAGLPRPSTNLFVAGHEVDAVWPDHRLAVELDSHEFHRTRAAFERDRVRDASLQLAGYRVLRVTHRRLETEPQAIVDTVRELLATSNNWFSHHARRSEARS